jgi:heavy metal sensor kinase
MTLTARLSAFFLGALAVVLVGFSASLYLLARAYLHREVADRLEAALDTLTAAAEREQGGLEWEPSQHHLTLGQDAGPEQVRWEVRDGEGRLVDHSPNLAAGTPDTSDALRTDRDGEPWQIAQRRLQAEPASPEAPGAAQADRARRHGVLVIRAGVSLAPLRTTLRRLALTLAGLSGGLWLAAAFLGRWVCRRALAPVTRMAQAAHEMGAADLDRRLPGPGAGDELDDLRRAFNGLLDRLQEAFERQRRFTGDASHQLRTPLTAVLGQVEVALRRDRPVEEYREVLASVHGQAAHLRRIVEALLFLARPDAEADLARLEVVDLAAWLPEQFRRWAGHPRAADLRLGPSPGGPLPVRAQPLLLGQLLENLLDNAVKYSEAGTPVTISLGRQPGVVTLTVEDAGAGIGAEDLPHVFEPFYRTAEARRRGRAGVGLGLAMVRRIASAFGGTVAAESEAGRGSRFTVRLPAV